LESSGKRQKIRKIKTRKKTIAARTKSSMVSTIKAAVAARGYHGKE